LANPWNLEDDSPDDSTAAPGFRFSGMLSGHIDGLTPEESKSLHPSTWQAMELWQAFLQNVDPLIKVLHIPTAQITVFTAMNNPQEATSAINSLLFSIYFAAVISLSPNEVRNILGQGKTSALDRFKLGFERSLVHSNFLEVPNLTTLQALTLFLVSSIPSFLLLR
jgi:hypothetical protein